MAKENDPGDVVLSEPVAVEIQEKPPEKLIIDDEVYAERVNSPASEKYELKHYHLQEKYNFIQAETSMLRQRVLAVRREVMKLSKEKRYLCGLLDERGDCSYKWYLEMTDEDPVESIFEYHPPPARKKAKPAVTRAKVVYQTPEQKEEEERAKQRIVSIIDSVFVESAQKRARNQQMQMMGPPPPKRHKPDMADAATSPVGFRDDDPVEPDPPEGNESSLALPYRMESIMESEGQPAQPDDFKEIFNGVGYSMIPKENSSTT